VAWKHYGTLKGQITEQVLAANPGLADYGPILPAGVTITLPDVDKVSKVEGIKLWG
jgi:phage tail protein X